MMRNVFYSLLASLVLFVFTPLQATVIHVPADSTTIQGGINGAVDGDTVLIALGTYHEYEIDFLGKAIMVKSTNPLDSAVVAATIVDGDSTGSVFLFQSGEDSTSVLSGLTITGGFAEFGGGIHCSNSDPLIDHNIITGNVCGTYWDQGGGGIYCDHSDAIITNNTIIGNTAIGMIGAEGGGIYCDYSNLTITSNLIADNIAGNGGGIACHGASIYSPKIRNNTIRGNLTEDYMGSGGGIFLHGNLQAIVENNLITGNRAFGVEANGGGISCNHSPSVITNNTITENSVFCFLNFGGGGIYVKSPWSPDHAPVITNTIVWNNESPIGPDLLDADGEATVEYSNIGGGWTGEGNIDTDPLFRDPAMGDYRLMAVDCDDPNDSPCIDTGSPLIIDAMLGCNRGLGSNRSDMGAYGGNNEDWLLPTDVEEMDDFPKIPRAIVLLQNYPNPFNPSTTISFDLPEKSGGTWPVNLTIYNIRGRRVKELIDSNLSPGHHKIHWEGRDDRGMKIGSGIYLYTLKAGEVTFTRKMVVFK